MAIDKMRILDTCTLDPGFRDRLIFWQEELQGIQACNVPSSMVAGELGGLLAAAQRQRQTEISFGVEAGMEDDGLCLSFRATKAITAGEQRMLSYTRQQFKHEQTMMARMLAEACSSGMMTPQQFSQQSGFQN